MLLALLLAVLPPCMPAYAGVSYTDSYGKAWTCTGSYWATASISPMAISCSGGGSSSGAVTVDGGSITVSNFPSVWSVTLDGGSANVAVSNWPSAFWQSTQPVSGTVSVAGYVPPDGGVNVNNFPASQAVTGSFWPSSQVVTVDSGTIDARVTNFPASQAVTGTFWQSTQPVSIASMPSTPVTGTFWQATQPVSLASAPTTSVTGTFWQATQPISLAASSIAGSNPCLNPTATLVGISGATSGTASVQLVALSGATKIYICSMSITGVSGTTPTFKLQYGTGTACATGTTGIVGPWSTAANTVYGFGSPFAVTPAGQALCYLQTGTTPVSNYNLTYVQQ